MAVENQVAGTDGTTRPTGGARGHGFQGVTKKLVHTFEVTAAASTTSTYKLPPLPSNARILGGSEVSFDDLASSGSGVLAAGVFDESGVNLITDDDDGIHSGIDVYTAAVNGGKLIEDPADIGKELWEFVKGTPPSADPGGNLVIGFTLETNDLNTGGTFTVEIEYMLP